MNRINPIVPEKASEDVLAMYKAVEKKLGRVPQMYQVMANSPAVLESYLGFQAALSKGVLEKKLTERIALAVAEKNKCSYCLSAHSFFAKKIGMSDIDIDASRNFNAPDAKTNAAMKFISDLTANPSQLSQNALGDLLEAGYSRAEVLEIIGHVVRNIYTNYINIISDTENDWPVIVKPATHLSYGA
jgi:uncharacterized peroxidase-related enzyme